MSALPECQSMLHTPLPPVLPTPLPPLALSACSIVRSYFACRKVAPKCCRCLSSSAGCQCRPVSHCRLASWDSKQLATLLATWPLQQAGPGSRCRRRHRSRAQLGVYLIFHMPPQLLQHTARLLATAAAAAAMSTAYTSGLASPGQGWAAAVASGQKEALCPLP